MKINKRKEKRALTIDNQVHGVRRKKKVKVDGVSASHQPSIEVIHLSDSKEVTTSSQQNKLVGRHKVNQKHINQQNLTSNGFKINGSFINQLLEMNGSLTSEDIDIQENPNQIFFTEDFYLDDSDDSEFISEPAVDTENCNKFFGIGKLVIVHCSICKVTLENVDDNYLRHLRSCLKCQSALLFQCRKCASFYEHFQLIWDHLKRSCKPLEINPSTKELAFKASDYNNSSRKETSASDDTPVLITLDSDSDNENNDNFIKCKSTLPIRIQSVEGGYNAQEKPTASRPITDNTVIENITSNDRLTKITNSRAPQNTEKEGLCCHYYKCEFKAESASTIKRHIARVHSDNTKNGSTACSKCRKKFKSLEKHQQKCCGVIHYKCKFCQKNAEVLFAIRKHLIVKHSQLFKWHELDGILMEIKLKRKAAKEMFQNACEKKVINQKKLKNSDIVSKFGDEIDQTIAKLSKINELLRIRCCKCKVTFEKVEEKVILRCPDCKSKLLYRCQLCDKLFAFFDQAWLHISYKCKSLKNKKITDIQSIPEKPVSEVPEVVEVPQQTYNCYHCDYKTSHKLQILQHMEIWHSCLNDDLGINFTACSRCGLAFEKPEDCKTHEDLHCGREMLLDCEFCPRVERRSYAMRIHLVKVHIQQLGSKNNLENVMDVIKTKRQNKREIGALPVLNQRDHFMAIEEV